MVGKPALQRNARTILRENALQIVMYLLGTVLVGLSIRSLGALYLAYSVFSNYLYMMWICPYCGHYLLGTCAAGFDLLSGKKFRPVAGRTFGREFRRRSWVLYPGWFLPPVAAAILLVTHCNWVVLVLFVLFCGVAFWWLPQDSRRHCENCETADCPRYPKKKIMVNG